MPKVMKVSAPEFFVLFIFCLGLVPVVRGFSSGRYDEHSFRHQQHYSHRIEQAVDDFKSSQAQSRRNASQVYLRHHRVSGNGESVHSTTAAPLMKQHHLRHHNRHHLAWEQRVFPSLHPKVTSGPLRSKLNLTGAMQAKYLDHEGSRSKSKSKSEQSKDRLRFADEEKKNFGDVYRFGYGSVEYEDDSWEKDKDSEKELMSDQEYSAENLDEYYDDDSWYDQDYSEEEDVDTLDDTSNKIDYKGQPKRRFSDDVENIYSRSYVPGSLTQHKFETLGTHEAVKQSRKSHVTSQKQHRVLANAHASKIFAEATCRVPKPRVEKIQKDPSKVYVPHCTILHRCGDDTGCCSMDSQTCVPKRTQDVDLYFFVKSLKVKQGTIERHTFINHTECHCVDKSKYPSQLPPAMIRRATVLDCNCPRLFEKLLQEDGFCRCDCSSGNSGCDWLKRGMEHFSMVDRKCITEGRCKPPTCEYGSYVKRQGRCPRKDDALYSRAYH